MMEATLRERCEMTTVLVVDAQPEMRRVLCDLLARGGLTVVDEAADIAGAIDRLRRRTPDLAIVDLSLPEINGLTGIRHLHTAHPDLSMILIAVHYSKTLREAALAAGAVDCVAKDELDLATARRWDSMAWKGTQP
jgi:CheY-like chemotaxis protein